jgi:hypothetical protein
MNLIPYERDIIENLLLEHHEKILKGMQSD